MSLTHCTLTGIDESTRTDILAHLSTKFPVVEWGILYSPKRQGQPGRYPSIAFIRNTLKTMPSHVRVALHICGRGVVDLLDGNECIVRDMVESIANRNGRIQLNFKANDMDVNLDHLQSLLDRFPSVTFITQHNEVNADVWRVLRGFKNHAVLFDASGGRGLSPEAWPLPLSGISCGYAGGLGPDNIIEQAALIDAVAGGSDYWIDMEGKLRNSVDHFYLDAANDVLMSLAGEHEVI